MTEDLTFKKEFERGKGQTIPTLRRSLLNKT